MRKQGLDEGPLDSLMENVVEDHLGKAGFLMVLQEGAKMLLSRIKTSTTPPPSHPVHKQSSQKETHTLLGRGKMAKGPAALGKGPISYTHCATLRVTTSRNGPLTNMASCQE